VPGGDQSGHLRQGIVRCTTNLKILAKKERIFQHHGMTVGIGIGIGIAIAVAIAIENRA